MKKLLFIISLILAGVTEAGAAVVERTVTINGSTCWGTSAATLTTSSSWYVDDVTVTQTPSTETRPYENEVSSGGTELRIYSDATLTFALPSNGTIISANISGTSNSTYLTPVASTGTLEAIPTGGGYTWTGSTSTLTLTSQATTGNVYFGYTSIELTYQLDLDLNSLVGVDSGTGLVSYNFNDATTSFDGLVLGTNTMTGGGVTLSTTTTGTDGPRFATGVTGGGISLFVPAGSTLRLRTEGYDDYLTSIVVETTDGSSTSFSASAGEVDNGTWSGRSGTVTLTFDADCQIASITAQPQTLYSVSITSYGQGITSYNSTPLSRELNMANTYEATATYYVQPGEEVTFGFAPDDQRRYVREASLDWRKYNPDTDSFTFSSSDESDITTQARTGTYTLSNIDADYTLQVSYDLQYPMINYGATGNGTITLNGTYLNANDEDDTYYGDAVRDNTTQIGLPYGANVTFTLTPDTGYRLGSLMLNGTTDVTSQVVNNVYSVSNVTQAMTLQATFVSDTPQPYARLSENAQGGLVLTFYYNTDKSVDGYDIGPFTSDADRGWHAARADIVTVAFDDSFADYSGLTSMNLWFYQLSGLTSVTGISNLNTANVASMRSLFNGCSSLTTLDLSTFSTASVTDMTSMFASCSNLTTITVGSGWATDAVTNGETMFSDCTSLVGGRGTTFATANLGVEYAHIDEGAANPGYLTPVGGYAAAPTFSWNGDMLTMATTTADAYITYMRNETTGERIDSTLYTAPLEITRNMLIRAFAGKIDMGISEIVSLDYPYTSWVALLAAIEDAQNVVTLATGNDNVTAADLQDLQTQLSEANSAYEARTADATTIDAMTQALEQISSTVRTQATAVDEPYAALNDEGTVLMFYYDKQKSNRNGMDIGPFASNAERGWDTLTPTITGVVFDASMANYTGLTSTAFWLHGTTELTSITGMENLNTQNVTDMQNMFAYCALPTIDVSSLNTSNVTNMNAMFIYCNNLTSLDLSTFNTENVTLMNEMFSFCPNLQSINFTGFNTSKVTEMVAMFDGCRALRTLDLSSFNTAALTAMGAMFMDNVALTTITVGNGWTTAGIGTGQRATDDVFTGCTVLVGGYGTNYASDRTDYTYAHIDGGSQNPGYLTPQGGYGQAATPTFARKDNKVAIESETEGATIYYTLDGSDPNGMSEVYSDSLTMERNLVIKAYAVRDNFTASTIATYNVDWFKVADVQFVQEGNIVTLSTTTPEATIYYTLSTDPTNEQVYQNPLVMTADCTITAWATRNGYDQSDVTEFEFHADGVTTSNPVFARDGNTITITTATPEAVIYYTMDGTEPTATSTQYNDPITVTRNGMIRAIAMRQNYYPSQITNYEVDWFKAEMPAFAWNGDNLTITTETQDATIWYAVTESGMQPVFNEYSAPVSVTTDGIIRAFATLDGYNNSDTLTIDYPYTAWYQLTEAIDFAAEVLQRCQGSTKVAQADVQELSNKLDEVNEYYLARTLEAATIEQVTSELNALANALQDQLDAAEFAFEASTGVLTVNGSTNMADALEAAGGRARVATTLTAIIWNSTATLADTDLEGLDNPNLLIFAQSADVVPQNRDNIVINGRAQNIVLTDDGSDNANFYCPQDFEAEMISYTRSFNQQTEVGVSRGWETIALPFTVQTITNERNGVIAPFGNNASEKHFWLRQLTSAGLAQATEIEANMPYLISMPNSDDYPLDFIQSGQVTFSSQNVLVPVTQTMVTEMQDNQGNMVVFVPTMSIVAQNTERMYALNVGQAYNGYAEGSVFVLNSRDIRPFEAYTIHESNGPAPQFMPIHTMTGAATGIEMVYSGQKDSETWYTLDGRRLQGKPAQHGLYILNGRKTVVR